ncbi:MAG: transposase [Candidatus Cryptobacteroides sp.]
MEVMFHNETEFKDGMNRILSVVACYDVLILAFVLMDTHVHFVLYGEFDSCNRFIHEYVRRTSMYLSLRNQKRRALKNIGISHQSVNDDRYLKTVICYVLKNPVSAGLPYNPCDYPWSSGSLYFRCPDSWTSPKWMLGLDDIVLKVQDKRLISKSRVKIEPGIRTVDGLILPNQYVAVEIVERLFRSHKAFNFFMSITKDIDIESRGGAISHLSVPLSEMRDNRRVLSLEMFGVAELRGLRMEQRLQLARRMKSQYNCSAKQIAKMCGLVYNEVIGLL